MRGRYLGNEMMLDELVKAAAVLTVGLGTAASTVTTAPMWEQLIEKGGVAAIAAALVAVLIRWFERVLDRWQTATGDQLKTVLSALDANRETNTRVALAIEAMTDQSRRVERLLESCARSQQVNR